jgi:hypothetical protein
MYIKRQNNVFTAIHTTGHQHVYMAEIFEGHLLQSCQSC